MHVFYKHGFKRNSRKQYDGYQRSIEWRIFENYDRATEEVSTEVGIEYLQVVKKTDGRYRVTREAYCIVMDEIDSCMLLLFITTLINNFVYTSLSRKSKRVTGSKKFPRRFPF